MNLQVKTAELLETISCKFSKEELLGMAGHRKRYYAVGKTSQRMSIARMEITDSYYLGHLPCYC